MHKISVIDWILDVNNYSDEDLQDIRNELYEAVDEVEREMEERRDEAK